MILCTPDDHILVSSVCSYITVIGHLYVVVSHVVPSFILVSVLYPLHVLSTDIVILYCVSGRRCHHSLCHMKYIIMMNANKIVVLSMIYSSSL